MLYGNVNGSHHDIHFEEFKDILTIALESESLDEFNLKYDIMGLENEDLKKIVSRRFTDGKE